MTQEIDIGGTRYIASKLAASRTGYTQDYVGQLARGGHIEAKRVSGMWYILEESLRAYKAKADLFVPTPPPLLTPKLESEVSISFEGTEYISAKRGGLLTGYNQDYIGQLARSGQILSRQVGTRWYVATEALLKHQKEKDALLAEVQAKSVGISHDSIRVAPMQNSISEPETHFSYTPGDNESLLPDIPSQTPSTEDWNQPQGESSSSSASESYGNTMDEDRDTEQEIPIRIMRDVAHEERQKRTSMQFVEVPMRTKKKSASRHVRVLIGGVLIALICVFGASVYLFAPRELSAVTRVSASLVAPLQKSVIRLLSKELVYVRTQ